jgi:hypothetical protein
MIKITSGPISANGGYSFESSDGGTKVSVAIDFEVGGFFKVAEPIVARTARRQYETNLSTLKDLLEAQGQA